MIRTSLAALLAAIPLSYISTSVSLGQGAPDTRPVAAGAVGVTASGVVGLSAGTITAGALGGGVIAAAAASGSADANDVPNMLDEMSQNAADKIADAIAQAGSENDAGEGEVEDVAQELDAHAPSGNQGSGSAGSGDQTSEAVAGDSGNSNALSDAELVALVEQQVGSGGNNGGGGNDGGGNNGGPPPGGYPYYDLGQLTPSGVAVQGSYRGDVTAQTYAGNALAGDVRLSLSLNPSSSGDAFMVNGYFDFGNDGTVGFLQSSPNGPVAFHLLQQSFLGGTITSTTGSALDLYGPKGEQYGGNFGFIVSGGNDPGEVAGHFVSSKSP